MEIKKQYLRREMSDRRNRMTPEARQARSREIFKKLTELDIYKDAGIIYSYGSFRSEVYTWDFNRRVLTDKKILALPKVISGTEMEFYKVCQMDELVKGYMGIMEPGRRCPVITPSEGTDLMILPGLAFDKALSRMGYGGGYYDRYLAGHRMQGLCCGIAFDFQLLDRVPKNAMDYSMDMIITESRILERMDKR